MATENRATTFIRQVRRAIRRRYARVDGWIAARYPVVWLTGVPVWLALAIPASFFAFRSGGGMVTHMNLDIERDLLLQGLLVVGVAPAIFFQGVMRSTAPGRLRRPVRERVMVYAIIVTMMIAAVAPPFVFARVHLPRAAALETPDSLARQLERHSPADFWLCAANADELNRALEPKLGEVRSDLRRYSFKTDGNAVAASEKECKEAGRPLSPTSVSLHVVRTSDAESSPNELLEFRSKVLDVAAAHAFMSDGTGAYRFFHANNFRWVVLVALLIGAIALVRIGAREQPPAARAARKQSALDRFISMWSARLDRLLARRSFPLWSSRLQVVAPNLLLGAALSILFREVAWLIVIVFAWNAAYLLTIQRQARGLSADLRTELGALAIHSLVVVSMTALVFVMDTRFADATPLWPYVMLAGSVTCAVVAALRLGSRSDVLNAFAGPVQTVSYVIVPLAFIGDYSAPVLVPVAVLVLAALVAAAAWVAKTNQSSDENQIIISIPIGTAAIGLLLVMAVLVQFDLSLDAEPRYLCLASAAVTASTAIGIAIVTPLRRFLVWR
jgi:nicotinamide riboside transporter PnuC